MSKLSQLYEVTKADHIKAKEVIIDAFTGDPLWDGISRFSKDKRQCASCFAEMAIRYSSKYGEIYAPSNMLEGIMMVTRSKMTYMTFPRIILSGVIFPFFKMEGPSRKIVMLDFEPLEQTRKKYMRGEFIYIQAIGVAKSLQGKGYGGKMLSALIEESIEKSLPIYLETETLKNVEIYKKFGFKVVEKLMLKKLEIPIWCMVR